MNKQKFIELLKKPSSFTKEEVTGLENVVRQYPYFQSAHLVLAKGSRITKDPKTKRRLSRAAVYCTDRALLKRYINGELIFLDSVNAPPLKIEDEVRKKPKQSSPLKPKVKSKTKKGALPTSVQDQETNTKDPSFDAGTVLEGIKDRIEKYKENKKNFENYIQNEEEDKAVNEALNKASTKEILQEKPTDTAPIEEEIDEPQTQNEIVDSSPIVDKNQEDIISSEKDDFDDFDISGIIEEIKNDDLKDTKIESKDIDEESEFEIDNLIEKVIEEESLGKENPSANDEKNFDKESIDQLIAEQVDNKTADEISIEAIETEKIEEKIIDEESIDQLIAEQVDNKTADELSIEAIETEKIEEKTIDEESIDQLIAEQVDNKTADEVSIEAIEAEKIEEKTIDEESIDQLITEQVDNKTVDEVSIEAIETEKIEEKTIDEVSIPEIDDKDKSEVQEDAPKPTYSNRIVISGSNRNKSNKESNESSESTDSPVVKPVASKEEAPKDTKLEVEANKEINLEDNENSIEEVKTDNLSVDHKNEQQEDTEDEILDSQEFQSQGIIHREKADDDDKKLSSGALRKAKMKKLKMQKDIINDFIDSSPSMPTPKPSFESEDEEEEVKKKDLAKEATKKEDEVISENMAIIYKNQRKIDKAIDIYRKLILKFPQKEAYFAARIKELNK